LQAITLFNSELAVIGDVTFGCVPVALREMKSATVRGANPLAGAALLLVVVAVFGAWVAHGLEGTATVYYDPATKHIYLLPGLVDLRHGAAVGQYLDHIERDGTQFYFIFFVKV
jgi:hypothetical protein